MVSPHQDHRRRYSSADSQGLSTQHHGKYYTSFSLDYRTFSFLASIHSAVRFNILSEAVLY